MVLAVVVATASLDAVAGGVAGDRDLLGDTAAECSARVQVPAVVLRGIEVIIYRNIITVLINVVFSDTKIRQGRKVRVLFFNVESAMV